MLVANRRSMIRIKTARWRGAMSDSGVNHENIFLAKSKDSESTTRAPRRLQRLDSASRAHRSINMQTTKSTVAQPLSAILTFANAGGTRVFAFACARLVAASFEALRARSPCRINTSLSWTLFFSTCWCIRNGVHLDSRMHAAIKPSHYIGGQYG